MKSYIEISFYNNKFNNRIFLSFGSIMNTRLFGDNSYSYFNKNLHFKCTLQKQFFLHNR